MDIRRSGFSPESRYSYRHSHSRNLQLDLHQTFADSGTLPYHTHPQGKKIINFKLQITKNLFAIWRLVIEISLSYGQASLFSVFGLILLKFSAPPISSPARGGKNRPVSCYAFFQGWLLLSRPPGCLRPMTSFDLTKN